MVQEKWQTLAEAAQKLRDDSAKKVDEYFPPRQGSKHWDPLPDPLPNNVTGLLKQYLDPADFDIVETDPIELLGKLARRQISAMEVAGAYIRAAVIAQRTINCVTEFLPEIAYERAKYLDEYIAENGSPVGPFHGLPISVKAMMTFKGKRINTGVTHGSDRVAEEDAQIVRILRDNGANFYVRTTQPQLLMHIEGDSYINGVTQNPFNRTLTSGGSSAGEGAILGMHASPLGVGTDIGGSIRWPAIAQGQYGFRPTTNRLPIGGGEHFMYGAEAIPASIGPMARTLETATLFSRVVIESEPWKEDPHLSGIPWNKDPLKGRKSLRIGIMNDDGVVRPHPPVLRAVQEVVSKIKKAGSVDGIDLELVEYKPYDPEKAWEIISSLYFEDGGKEVLGLLEETGEPVAELTKWLINDNPNVRELTISELWKLNNQKAQYKLDHAKHWNAHNIDVLICPVGPGGAAPHNHSKYWGYTAHWNLVDYPSVTFPVTSVDPKVDVVDESYVPRNDKDKFNHELYHPDRFEHAPIGLQLVALRSHDELVLEAMKLVECAIRA